jgi:NADPH:quinone reductase-like Zn-dependent oxidoreductase
VSHLVAQGLPHEHDVAGHEPQGVVAEVGAGVEGFAAGDEVIGFTHNRASHAELVVAEAQDLTPRPSAVPWEVAGSLFVVGTSAVAAVRAVSRAHGNKCPAGAHTQAHQARLIADGRLEIPIARVYPLAEVRDAFRELELRHTLGKIVLRP